MTHLWTIFLLAVDYLPDLANILLAVVGVLMSFPQKAQRIEDNPRLRKIVAGVCIVLGVAAFFASGHQRRQFNSDVQNIIANTKTSVDQTKTVLGEMKSVLDQTKTVVDRTGGLMTNTDTAVTSLAQQQEEFEMMLSQNREHFDRTFSRFADVQRTVVKASTDQAIATAQQTALVEALRSHQCGVTDSVVAVVTKMRDRLLYLSADILGLIATREVGRGRNVPANYDQETVVEYGKQFGSQVNEISKGLGANGVKDERLDFLVEHANSIANIRELSERLAVLADKFPR